MPSSKYAKLISAEPPTVHDGFREIRVTGGLPSDVKLGDWVRISFKNKNECSVKETGNKTLNKFPGYEWNRLQTPLNNGITRMDILRLRSKIISFIRSFFISRGFWEVETPVLVPSPGVETHLSALKADNMYLSPSPEFQMKRLIAGGSGSIFQIVKSFRGDEQGRHHNPEFTMLEWYSVGTDSEGLRQETEELILFLASELNLTTVFPSLPWRRLTVSAAFAEYAGIKDIFSFEELKSFCVKKTFFPDSWEEAFFYVFVNYVEPYFTDKGPVFLTHWPAEFASLSRILPEEPRFADRFELFVENLELANGFGELIDGEEQRKRMLSDSEERRRTGKPLYPIDEKFLSALYEGMPPVSGIALGIDRLVMLLTGMDNIEHVLSFSSSEL